MMDEKRIASVENITSLNEAAFLLRKCAQDVFEGGGTVPEWEPLCDAAHQCEKLANQMKKELK